MLARTDLLSAQDRRAIQAASVLGQRFSLPHLQELLCEPRYTCDTLVRNVLLRPVRDGLQFVHALVRDGVYGSLTQARRRELHKAAAAIFVDDPVLRAEHLDRAGDAGRRGPISKPPIRKRAFSGTIRPSRSPRAAWRSRSKPARSSILRCSSAICSKLTHSSRHQGMNGICAQLPLTT